MLQPEMLGVQFGWRDGDPLRGSVPGINLGPAAAVAECFFQVAHPRGHPAGLLREQPGLTGVLHSLRWCWGEDVDGF